MDGPIANPEPNQLTGNIWLLKQTLNDLSFFSYHRYINLDRQTHRQHILTSNSDFSLSYQDIKNQIPDVSNQIGDFINQNQTFSNQILNFYKTMHILHIKLKVFT